VTVCRQWVAWLLVALIAKFILGGDLSPLRLAVERGRRVGVGAGAPLSASLIGREGHDRSENESEHDCGDDDG